MLEKCICLMIFFPLSSSQGFASGDLDADAWAVRYFVNDRKMEILCSQSFAKNFGLYNERPGNLVFVVNNKDVVAPVKSQVRNQHTNITRVKMLCRIRKDLLEPIGPSLLKGANLTR